MNSTSHPKSVSKRITELDGLRGVAILLVLIHHYLGQQLRIHPAKGSALGYFYRAIGLTWSGVDLFFILSGFLIAGILLENKPAANYFSVFYLRRICRIFPLYFLVLGGFVAARAFLGEQAPFGWLFGKPLPLWSYATFTQNILMCVMDSYGSRWLASTWSLAVEEQFYLFLPILIWLLPRRAIPAILLVLVCTAVALRAVRPGIVAYVGTPWRADSLLTGALLAYAVRSRDFLNAVGSRKWLLRAMLGALFCGALVLSTSAFENWAQQGGALVHFWLALLYAVLLLFVLVEPDGWTGALLRNRVLIWFGTVSYGIYMFHIAVLGLVQAGAGNDPPVIKNWHDFAVTMAALLVTILLAAVSFHGFESRILRWGHRFRYRQDKAVEATPVFARDLS